MATLKEVALRYSPLANEQDREIGESGEVNTDNEIVENKGKAMSTESIARSSNYISIGLQACAADITRNILEANSVTSLPLSPLDSTAVKTSAFSGTNRKLSLNECSSKLFDSPPRKTSVPFASDRKFSLHDISGPIKASSSSSRKTSLSLGLDRKISLGDCNNHFVTTSRKTSVSVDTDRKISLNDSISSVSCRICLDGEIPGEQLFNPCLCTGSASHVHITCLKKWLMTSGSSVCELCLYELDVGWKTTSMWKALKELSNVRMTNRKICWALLVSIAALTLPLFCICVFVLDDEDLRLQLSKPASMAVSYGVILISCAAYLTLLFMVAYLTWKWDFCPSTTRCHFPTEIEIRVESLEERLKRGRTRRNGYYRNTTPILSHEENDGDSRNFGVMDQYWMNGAGYI
ncbi:uncharacterized protein LOC115918756 [Strongylocentrotus purpuratus]|uniref:RING-CH-type domain-containing protein n=1 Tax=Strongylocentrotus purpuratus TaxID=7668 RepID=A0A7M7T0Q7_STRPU|nr:uncharacterized protein LOC115918756 [Strongylocentrotus purpuratus]